jgi:hypothetical protein
MLKSLHILMVVLAVLSGYAEGQKYTGPNSLGPFRIDKDVSVKSLFRQLGEPTSTAGEVFCYRSQAGEHSVTLTRMVAAYDAKVAGTVTLSSFPNCVKQTVRTTTENLAAWKTERGIGLSSTAADVLKAYGKPTREDRIEGTKYRWVIHGDRIDHRYTPEKRPQLGDTVLVYQGAADDLRIAEFGIRHGKVVWISLSKNE